jgi:NAD(P)-dependent dehydrogenase (short-subunit alcohol dehydrogenase family)
VSGRRDRRARRRRSRRLARDEALAPEFRGPAVKELEGKVAVITGAGSGIGAALARACADAGMDVAVVDVDRQRAGESAARVGESGRRALPFCVDVADADAVDRLAADVFESLGGCHLLCNNAGVSPLGCSWQHPHAEWRRTLEINLLGVVHAVNAFVPRLLAQEQPAHIVNTASAAALRLVPASALYVATKFAVLGFSECLREELAPHRIGVSALCPGGVATQIAATAAGGVVGRRTPEQVHASVQELVAGVDRAHISAIAPERVAELVLEGVRENLPYIITHPGSLPAVARRAAAIESAYSTQRQRHPELP